MGPEGSFYRHTVEFFGASPALGRSQDNHGPWANAVEFTDSRVTLDGGDFGNDFIHGGGHFLMHFQWIATLDEPALVAVAFEQRLQLRVRNAGENCRAGDFGAVQMQDGQNRAIP